MLFLFEMRNLSKPKLQGVHAAHYKYNKVRERAPVEHATNWALKERTRAANWFGSGLLWRTELLFPFLK